MPAVVRPASRSGDPAARFFRRGFHSRSPSAVRSIEMTSSTDRRLTNISNVRAIHPPPTSDIPAAAEISAGGRIALFHADERFRDAFAIRRERGVSSAPERR